MKPTTSKRAPTHPFARFAVGLLVAASTIPFIAWTVSWWADNALAMVSFSLMMPLAAAAACVTRLRLGGWPPTASSPPRLGAGLLVLAASAIALAAAGWLRDEPILASTGLWLALIAIVALIRGAQAARRLALPLSPLILMAPLTFGLPARLEAALQVLSAVVAELWLRVLGVPVIRAGVVLQTPGLRNTVDDTCSGVGTFTALFVYAVILGVIVRVRERQLTLVCLLTLPLGLLVNGVRIAWISILGERGGVALATGPLHDVSGYVTFGVAYALLLGLLLLLRRRQNLAAKAGTNKASTSESGPSR